MLPLLTLHALAGAPSVPLDDLPRASTKRPSNPDGSAHPVTARLFADVGAVRPGETARVGLLLEHHDGWHTYWHSNPDVGQPTEIAWTGPEGIAFGSLTFPIPDRFDDEGIISFGYHDDVLLFVEVTVPPDAKRGDVIPIAAEARWLACKVSCIPARAILRTRLDVSTRRKRLGPSPQAPLFDYFAARHPVPVSTLPLEITHRLEPTAPTPGKEFEAVFTVRSTGPTLSIPDLPETAPWPFFTPVLDSEQWMLYTSEVRPGEGAVEVRVEGEVFELEEQPKSSRIGGLFQVVLDGEAIWTEVTMPMAIGTATDH